MKYHENRILITKSPTVQSQSLPRDFVKASAAEEVLKPALEEAPSFGFVSDKA